MSLPSGENAGYAAAWIWSLMGRSFIRSLPSTFTGMRIAVGIAFTCVIVAELIAVRSGLGYLITEARMLVRADIVIAGMISIGIVGFALDAIVRVIMKRTLRWQKGLMTE